MTETPELLPTDDKSEPEMATNSDLQKPKEHHHKSILEYFKEFARPAYHIRKIKEDVQASIHALQNRDLETLKDDPKSLAQAIRGRLLASYFLVGPFGILGPICGAWYQYRIAPHLPFASFTTFLVTILVGNLFSVIGFQTIWGVSSRALYRMDPPKFYDFLAMWRDILPLQWDGFKRWAGANVVLMPISMLALSLIGKFLPVVDHTIPIGVLTPGLELIFVHTSLIRLMGDLFERESHRIAANHCC